MNRTNPLHCSHKARYFTVLIGLSLYTLILFIFGYLSGHSQWYGQDELEDIPLPELDSRGIPLPTRNRYVARLRLHPGWRQLYPNSKFKRVRRTHHEVIEGSWIPPLDHYNRSYRHCPGYVSETPDICLTDPDRHPVLLFTFVLSAPSNVAKRKLWRTYWGSKQEWMRVAFVVGQSASPNLNEGLVRENAENGDLILLDYVDTYSGLTTKTATMLEWVTKHCSHAQYVLKTDDDVMINFSGFRDFIDKEIKTVHFYGGSGSTPKPLRDSTKWKVSYHDYPFEKYPNYVLGSGILMSMPTLLKFYNESVHIAHFAFEDVFLGMCARAAGVNLTIMKTFRGFDKAHYGAEPVASEMARGNILLAHGIAPGIAPEIYQRMKKLLQGQTP